MRCLVAGGSGLVGHELLQLLDRDSRVDQVVAVSRRALGFQSKKISDLILNWDQPEAFQLPPADVAFCSLGSTIKKAGSQEAFRKVDHDYVIQFAQSAKKAGVRKFLMVSAIGADEKSAIFYSRVKGETERDLEKVGFESLTVFRPSLLLGERAEKRFGEKLAIQLFPLYRPFLVGPLAKQMPIEAKRVAQKMVEFTFAPVPGFRIVTNEEMLRPCGDFL